MTLYFHTIYLVVEEERRILTHAGVTVILSYLVLVLAVLSFVLDVAVWIPLVSQKRKQVFNLILQNPS